MPLIDKPKYLCSGCGACAVTCPKHCISYTINFMGQLMPKIDYNKCIECHVCERVCPIYNLKQDSDPEKYSKIVGRYLCCYEGYDQKFRLTSASGGLLTSVLAFLLESKKVDYVICVSNTKKNDRFYSYDIISNQSELVKNSRSAYYPLEMSEPLNYIEEHPGRYAMVVLPCQVSGIRMIQQRNKVIKERLVFLLGLVCGGLPGSAMIEYTANDNCINYQDIVSISFRDKDDKFLNRNYGLTFTLINGEKIRSSFPDQAFGVAFLNKLFHYKACNFCNDVFAEQADAVFMDAWLPKHREDKLGTSICIVRNLKLKKELDVLFFNNPNCFETDIETAIEAQNSVGLIQRKKKQSFFKRALYRKLGYYSPKVSSPRLSLKEKLKFLVRASQELIIQNESSRLWYKYKKNRISFKKFRVYMNRLIALLKII